MTRRIEAMGGSRARQADRDLYRELWRTLIEAIRLESGKQVIVDSSKSSRASTNRILSLAGLAGFDMHVIHLVRDPRALMWSALRGSNRLMEAGKQGTLRGGIFRMLVGWSLANLSVHMSRRANPSIKVIRIRYEDLVSQPVEELKRLGEFLGLDFSTTIDSLVHQRPLDPGHGVKGNRMRRQGPVHIRGDEEWKTALPRHARVLAMLSWPLARLYGYDVLHDAA